MHVLQMGMGEQPLCLLRSCACVSLRCAFLNISRCSGLQKLGLCSYKQPSCLSVPIRHSDFLSAVTYMHNLRVGNCKFFCFPDLHSRITFHMSDRKFSLSDADQTIKLATAYLLRGLVRLTTVKIRK